MKPIHVLACSLLLGLLVASARGDQTTSTVQQALKDQGFYYGDVTGQKNSDTTAAIRRYQIRNGLQVTGEIDAETLRSLGVGQGNRAPAASTPAPADRSSEPAQDYSDDQNSGQTAELPPQDEPRERTPQRGPGNAYAPGPPGLGPGVVSGVFDGTPYEIAPPDLQRHVIVGAQTLLARAGYYRSGIDGEFGPGTIAALRAFQRRAGIPPDGRLNMETLAALGLLPGQHGPRVQRRRPFPHQPVYRGQWIPE